MPGSGVTEGYAEGMETESSGNSFCAGSHTIVSVAVVYRVPSIEQVTDDGASEAKMMGTMDAQLVCAACVRMQQQVSCSVFVDADDFVFCVCRLALSEIDFLTRAFIIVR